VKLNPNHKHRVGFVAWTGVQIIAGGSGQSSVFASNIRGSAWYLR